jgi:hypothetical protein
MSEEQNMCPICCEEFKSKEVVVNFERWGYESSKAHLDCLLYLSAIEERAQHPPLRYLK